MLTEKQEKFAQNIIQGMTQADAYRAAYSCKNMSDNAIYREASLLLDNPKVTQRLKEIRDINAGPSIMTAKRRKEWLTEVINDKDVDINARLKASDQLNRMEGEYVTKICGDLNVAKLEDLL